ncbi:DegT/DnrJ/EryC1/StrS family aminotransferase [Micromonospora psammae]|uniref:DegT/DnrJ/EryC1/StrS family aminotransferase n=1 Tax=Micromonospora sp. CPCC 205556 TaxID=3122398 RepID=UPI002FF3C2DC
MTNRFVVPYHGQGSVFDEDDVAAVTRLLRSDAHLSGGRERGAFEDEFARHTGARHAVSTTSCTMALELATHLLGLRPGDEVVASPLTFQATVAPLLSRPVGVRFADIDPDTLALRPEAVDRVVGPRTRAIYVTHYGGLPADLDGLVAVARQHDLLLLEDCAHALGSRYRGHSAGTVGDLGCWSFHSLKNMSTMGQGGMVTCRDDRWADTLRRIRAMEPDADFRPRTTPPSFGGRRPPGPEDPERHAKNAYTDDCTAIRHGGLNATMSEPAAAVGRTQLAKLPAMVARRREIAARLHTGLADLPGVVPHRDLPGTVHSYHLYTLRITDAAPGLRDEVVRRLHHEHGVEMILRYFPLHLLPEWRRRGGAYGQAPTAERIWFDELVNLPIYPAMTDRQVDHLVDAVRAAVIRARGGLLRARAVAS